MWVSGVLHASVASPQYSLRKILCGTFNRPQNETGPNQNMMLKLDREARSQSVTKVELKVCSSTFGRTTATDLAWKMRTNLTEHFESYSSTAICDNSVVSCLRRTIYHRI